MEQPIKEQFEINSIKPRNVFIAFLFSLFFPGLGQVYNGQPKKAILFFGLLLLFPVFFGIARGATFFYGLLAFLFVMMCLRIFIIIDGMIYAKRQKEYVLKKYNRWFYYLLIAIAMSAILWFYNLDSILEVQVFRIPTTSSYPTLHVGDHVVADLKVYKNSEPNYGDIVVYSNPDGYMYIFRIVGLPNDTIALNDNVLSVNGKPCGETFVKDTIFEDISVKEFLEELPNGHKHSIYKFIQPNYLAKSNVTDIVVPADNYYLLGDNRDNAADSRYEGFVSKDEIKGRVVYIYFSREIDRINIDFRDK